MAICHGSYEEPNETKSDDTDLGLEIFVRGLLLDPVDCSIHDMLNITEICRRYCDIV